MNCPACFSPSSTFLGTLGTLAHHRCRNCGHTFDTPADLSPCAECGKSLPTNILNSILSLENGVRTTTLVCDDCAQLHLDHDDAYHDRYGDDEWDDDDDGDDDDI